MGHEITSSCVFQRPRVCVPSLSACMCVGGMAAERFINPVHQGSLGFTLRHPRLKDASVTQARQQDGTSLQY